MKRLWFIEGMDAVGKTTLVRELCNRSGHKISGVMDRGPLSRIVWAKEGGLEAEAADWLTWFRESKYTVGVLLLISDWATVRATLEDEALNPEFRGVRWTESEWNRMQNQYIMYHGSLTALGVRSYLVPAHLGLVDTLNTASWLMGYARDVFDHPAANPVGQREVLSDRRPQG